MTGPGKGEVMWNQIVIIGNICLAFILGGAIGFERETASKPAGFRTHMLVAGAAAFLINLGQPLLDRFGTTGAAGWLRADPIRLFEAIITAVAFICAGTILRRGEDRVEGLTTAASILMSGVIGISVALDQYVLAVAITLLTLFSLRLMRFVEKRLGYKKDTKGGSEKD